MPKVQYKAKKGVLHIGGGRFFHAQKPVEVTAKQRDELLKMYKDLEEVKPQQQTGTPEEQPKDQNKE